MLTLHCPKCGFVTDGTGLTDTTAMRCADCGFNYHVADGNIWNATTNQAIKHVAKCVYGLINFQELNPQKFKIAVVKALLELGWLGTPVASPGTNNRVDKVVEMTERVTVAHDFPKNRA